MVRRYVEPMFLPHSFAYQEGKGILDAAMLVRDYVSRGKRFLCELDIKDYFGSIDLGRLHKILRGLLDPDVTSLIWVFLTREIEREGKIERISRGLLQGSSISPALANLYLHGFDQELDEIGASWMRLSDNIYVCCETSDEASLERRILGYDLSEAPGGAIEIRKHTYLRTHVQAHWATSVVEKSHGSYHIVQDGVLNRKDYSLLFENEDEKHHIPVGVTEQLNVYGNVTVSPDALATLSKAGIRIAYLDEYGSLIGTYVPESHGKAADVFLRQCALYNDPARRLDMARRFQLAAIHNMRENLRYYLRRGREELDEHVTYLSACAKEANECKDVDSLMLIEARAKRRYYNGFSIIVEKAGFAFAQRTKRPPKDPCNAMISFGNVVLYNVFLQMIWKTSLDPKIGVAHATNRRSFSLNLDFADLFKPVVVDRVIFSLANRHEIKSDVHFRVVKSRGVMLNADGKRLFIDHLEQKLDARAAGKGKGVSYRQVMAEEVAAFQRLVRNGDIYKPYKYY